MAKKKNFKKSDVQKYKKIAILAYLFVPLALIFKIEGDYLKFHIKQGFNLFATTIITTFAYYIVMGLTRYEVKCIRDGLAYSCGEFKSNTFVSVIFVIIMLFLIYLMISGIRNAITGKVKKLPVIGNINLI